MYALVDDYTHAVNAAMCMGPQANPESTPSCFFPKRGPILCWKMNAVKFKQQCCIKQPQAPQNLKRATSASINKP